MIEKFYAFGLLTTENKNFLTENSIIYLNKKIILLCFGYELKRFPILRNKYLKILLPFVTSYSCKTSFCLWAGLKTKYKSRFVIQKEMRYLQ